MLVAVLDDLEEIAALVSVETLRPPVVEDQQVDPGEGLAEPRISAVTAGEREGGKQARHAMVGDGEVVPAGLLAEGTGEPAFADTGWPRQQNALPCG